MIRMKLRAKYRRSHYKTDDSFLNAVYRDNKALIDERLEGVGAEGGVSVLQQFKYLVKETQQKIKNRTGRDPSITTAMNRFTASRDFTPIEIHMRENMVKGLKNFGALRTLYKLTGHKFDPDMVVYIGDNMYSYRGYVIKLTNSPKSIEIYDRVGDRGKVVATIKKQSEWYVI